jgi:DNA-binding transcriptional LysR family regulator
MDFSVTGLRVFREVAERGTLTAAATALGYTQSAVSRQIAALERAARAPLLERHPGGVRLTPAGHVVLRRAAAVLAELDAAARELAGLPATAGTVRLGWFPSAGAVLVPRAIATLRRTHPAVTVTTREATTPALVRALRAGTLDLALVASAPPFRPLDHEPPPHPASSPTSSATSSAAGSAIGSAASARAGASVALEVEVLAERELRVAVPDTHPLAGAASVTVAELRGQPWIASPSAGEESLMGAWPGVDERPHVTHTARDWLAKLHLVAAGCGLTTLPASLVPAVPPGVHVLTVRDGPRELRRLLLARRPGPLTAPTSHLAEALRHAATDTPTSPTGGR